MRVVPALAVLLLSCPAAHAETRWTATSTAATAITGDIVVNEDSVVFSNGAAIAISPTGTNGVYRVTPPSNPVLVNGNRLCGGPATFVALLPGQGDPDLAHSSSLSLHAFEGDRMPSAAGAGPGRCAILNYERTGAGQSGALPAEDGDAATAAVRQAQELLNAMGYDAGPADGAFGTRSRRALAEFQADNLFDVTGRLDAESFGSLIYVSEGEMGPLGNSDDKMTDAVRGPAFDCNAATTPTERGICADAGLSALDAQMAHEWRLANLAAVRGGRLDRAGQKRWLALRDGCVSDRECIERAYRARLAEFRRRR